MRHTESSDLGHKKDVFVLLFLSYFCSSHSVANVFFCHPSSITFQLFVSFPMHTNIHSNNSLFSGFMILQNKFIRLQRLSDFS